MHSMTKTYFLKFIFFYIIHLLFSMAKLSQQKTQKNNASDNNNVNATNTKVKRTRRSVPRDSPIQRSSIYRGVTRLYCLSFHATLYFIITVFTINQRLDTNKQA